MSGGKDNDAVGPGFFDGFRLGLYQANALGGPLVSAIVWHFAWWLSVVLLVASALAWWGWKRDYDWRWRP